MDRIVQSDVRQHKRRPRINKHLTERKRRARINDSLLQLKSIVYPALNDKLSQNSKVEKADILEMTLLYLRGLQGQTYCKSTADQFQAGFTKCFGEVSQFLLSCDSVDGVTRVKLLNHLADFCTRKTPPTTPTQPEHQIFSPKTASYSDPQPLASFSHDTMLPIRAPPLRELNCELRTTATTDQKYPCGIQEQYFPEVTVLTPPSSPSIRQHPTPTPKGCVMSGYINRHGPSYTNGAPMWRPWLR